VLAELDGSMDQPEPELDSSMDEPNSELLALLSHQLPIDETDNEHLLAGFVNTCIVFVNTTENDNTKKDEN